MTQLIRIGVCAVLAWVSLIGAGAAQGRTFVAEGTDVAQGVGARYLGMAGMGTSFANDPYAIFYNPALLAGLDRPMFSVTRQANAELRRYSFIGFATPFPILEPLGVDLTLGFARYPRVHARSTGAFAETDPQSVFLRLLLPGLFGTYDGRIDSKTFVNRFAAGLSPSNSDRWSVGFSVDVIDCTTGTCGVRLDTGTYESHSVHATATSFSVGGVYKFSDRFSIAASYVDIHTNLRSTSIVTTPSGTTTTTAVSRLPATVSVEANWQATDKLMLAAGYRAFLGLYGSRKVDLSTATLSGEYVFDHGVSLRAGLLKPVKTSLNGTKYSLPVPVVPSMGLGWANDDFSVDVAGYVHPIMSFHYGRPAPTLELSLGYKF